MKTETIVALIGAIALIVVAVINLFSENSTNVSVNTNVYSEKPVKTPFFEGRVEHGENKKFFDFLTENDDKLVYLDVDFSDIEFENSSDANDDQGYFLVKDDPACNYIACEGTEILITQNAVHYVNGYWYIKGYFILHYAKGMHQGVISMHLEAVTSKEIVLSEK